jgi:hypothetical protein
VTTATRRELISLKSVAGLTRFALDVLPNPGDTDMPFCCASCCAPCGALQEMLDAGTLSTVLAADPEVLGSDYWTDTGIDVDWVTTRMHRTCPQCPDPADG